MASIKCKACGSELQTRDVQMRSADEAHTSITSCPNCPVNPNKINSNKIPATPLKGIHRRVMRRSLPVIPTKFDNGKCAYTLVADIPLSHDLMNVELNLLHLIQYLYIHNRRLSDATIGQKTPPFFVVNGIYKDNCVSYNNRKLIGIGLYIETYNILTYNESSNEQAIIKGRYLNWDKIDKYSSYIYSEYNGTNRKLIVDLGYDIPSKYILKDIVTYIYSHGIIPDNISKYISRNTVNVFGNLAPRRWDASIPPETGYKFTCKPDGQNMWLFWIGNVWYKFKPNCREGIKAWSWTDSANNNDMIVLSVEDMSSHGYIVIDCFTDENGNIAKDSRDIDWVVNTAQLIMKNNKKIPLLIRKYFDDYKLAEEYSSKLPYPVDGIVAVRNGSTEILKIKSIRSMELYLSEDNILTTSDNIPVIKCPDSVSNRYKTGTIFEVRFKVINTNTIHVFDLFQRTDIYNANLSDAVSNIIRSDCKLVTPDDNERRVALLWCNNLRKQLYQLAYDHNSSKSIIVDIGTGTGQSLDAIIQSETVSYVFIEPDTVRCKSIARRLDVKRILKDPGDIIPIIKSLKTRSVKYAILNSTISEIVKHSRALDILFSEAKSVTCTFSIHFITDELRYIVSNYNTPIYGCAYTYDNAVNGILVDSCGVLMKQTDSDNATVKWGGDKQYNEPVTLQRDYAGIGKTIPGSDVVNLPDKNLTNGAYNICRHVTVVLP